jgi:hypothetical protein
MGIGVIVLKKGPVKFDLAAVIGLDMVLCLNVAPLGEGDEAFVYVKSNHSLLRVDFST